MLSRNFPVCRKHVSTFQRGCGPTTSDHFEASSQSEALAASHDRMTDHNFHFVPMGTQTQRWRGNKHLFHASRHGPGKLTILTGPCLGAYLSTPVRAHTHLALPRPRLSHPHQVEEPSPWPFFSAKSSCRSLSVAIGQNNRQSFFSLPAMLRSTLVITP